MSEAPKDKNTPGVTLTRAYEKKFPKMNSATSHDGNPGALPSGRHAPVCRIGHCV